MISTLLWWVEAEINIKILHRLELLQSRSPLAKSHFFETVTNCTFIRFNPRSHLMASKMVTCLMIVEAVFSPFRRDTTCLTKRFLYLALRFLIIPLIIPASPGYSIEVLFVGKNTSLMNSSRPCRVSGWLGALSREKITWQFSSFNCLSSRPSMWPVISVFTHDFA